MFTIVIPLFNEEKNIINLFNEILHNLKKYKNYEIILVDDLSTDNTIKIIEEFSYTNLKIIKNTHNNGQNYINQ